MICSARAHRRQQVLVGRMLRAAGVAVRHPHRGQPQALREHVVGQRAAQVRQQHRLAPGRGLDRLQRKAHPGVVRVQPCRLHHHRLAHLDGAEALCLQMLLHMLAQPADVGADDEAQLQRGLRVRRDGVDREVGVAGAHRQHFQRVPGEHALDRRQPGLAPVGVDRRVVRTAAGLQTGQRVAHVGGDRRRTQPGHEDAAVAVDQAGDRRGQHRAGVAQQPAPVARVVRALAQLQCQVEVGDAARAQEQRRRCGAQPRAVGGDQRVGGQRLALQRAELGQAGRAGLLAGLEQPLGVEAELAAARFDHPGQRGEVDAVLALVVRRAAAVEPVAVLRQRPWAAAARPRGILAAHHVAMAVHQHRRQRVVLVARGDQEGPAACALQRVVEDLAGESQRGQ